MNENKNNKILIINPLNETEENTKFSHHDHHRLRQPLGLAYVSSFLKKITNVQLIDAAALGWGREKTIEYINIVKPEILIVSSGDIDKWQNPDLDISSVFEIINKAEVKNKIFVGTQGSVTPDWIFENCKTDFVVRSEPEQTCFELVENILKNDRDFSNIDGLSYKNQNKILHNKDRVFDSNLDEYPFPDYESLPMHLYSYTTDDLPSPFSLMLTSRGCPARCVFCLKKMMPGKYRTRSAQNVFKEIKYLADNFGIQSIYFQDWEFLIDKKRVQDLCSLIINSGLKINWGCSARATSLNKEIVVLMKKAGCTLINFGYESGSAEILKACLKGVTPQIMKEAVLFSQKEGINVRPFCLVNLPGENRETLKESALFLKENNLEISHINIPIPYPGTELSKMIGCVSWNKALENAGRIGTTLEPEKARKILRSYLWQGKYGKIYFLNPKFWLHILRILF